MNTFDTLTSPLKKNEPSDIYWPLDPNPKNIVSYIDQRRSDFWNLLKNSGIDDRIHRCWRYYHNFYYFGGQWHSMEIQRGGESGNQAKIAVNHFRSLINGIITYVTKDKPAWDTRAINSDNDALLAAELGNSILDFYMEDKGVEDNTRKAVEESMIFTAAYVKVEWDEDQGSEINADPVTGQIFHEGDLKFTNLNLYDVIFDFNLSNWKDSRWICIRTPRLKWELIDKYGESFKSDILNAENNQSAYYYPNIGLESKFVDVVDFWEFFHDKTPIVPDGIYLPFVGSTPLSDPQPLPRWCKRKPVYRIIPASLLTTPLGYTPAFDLLGVQEAINAEVSTIVTNHANLGPTKVWIKQGDTVNMADLEPGWSVIQTDTPIQPLNLSAGSSREFIPFKDSLVRDAEYLSGINSVARGQPQESLRSASAVEFVEQKAVQYQAPIIQAYYRFLSEIGTGALDILKEMADTERIIYVAGVNNKTQLKSFQKENLSKVNRVAVIPGNAATQTPVGRANMATELIQSGMLKTPEEYITVRMTGQVRPLTEANDAQLMKVHAENELLRQAKRVSADILDNQVFHILKHQSIIDSPEMQADPFIQPSVKAHILQHLEILLSPEGQAYQRILGYSVPVPPIMGNMPQGSVGEANPNQKTQGIPGLGAPPAGADMPMDQEQPGVAGNEPGGM